MSVPVESDPSNKDKLPKPPTPPEAINLNVAGKELVGPASGFGWLWRKTYRIRLAGAPLGPRELIRRWKAKYSDYWPQGSNFYGSRRRIEKGDVAVINLEGPAGSQIATGVAVIQSDDDSFTFVTPQGHIFAGTITFSAFDEAGVTVAQIVSFIRAGDPLFEVGVRLGLVHKQEDDFWGKTLTNLALDCGVRGQPVSIETVLLDRSVRWSAARNVWHNAAIRTALYLPLHGLKRLVGR